jgi:methyl-accepting chemotaxis protein
MSARGPLMGRTAYRIQKGLSVMKNLSVRKKISLGFGIILILLAVVSAVGILSVNKISRNATFVKDTAFRQALTVMEMESMLSQILADITRSVDTATNQGLVEATKLKKEIDKKWTEVDTVFAKNPGILNSFHALKEKMDNNFRFGQDLVRLTLNQEWAEIGRATTRFNSSRDELFSLLSGLKANAIKQLDSSLNEIAALSRNAAAMTSFILFLAVLAGIALTYLIASHILDPIRKLMEGTSALAAGDLTKEVRIDSADEIGTLARAFNHMTGSLRQMLNKVTATFTSLSDASVNVSRISQNISGGSAETAKAIGTAYRLVDEIQKTVEDITKNMQDFSKMTEEIESWILEMSTSISEAASNAEALSTSVNDTTSSIHEMSSSISRVAGHVGSLLELQTAASSSIAEINNAIKEVETITHTSASLTEKVSRITAEDGMQSVTKAMQGILAIRDHVNQSVEVIRGLGSTVENIGKIVKVIDDIADKTKLLSLNASILAAQSGEHGKGFTVVAEEIGGLSESTIRSTKEIADLVSATRNESKKAVDSMFESSQITEEGVSLVKKVEQILTEINRSAASSSEIAQQIARSGGEQAKGASLVFESIQDVTAMCENINRATSEQTKGIGLIVKAAESMKEISYVSKRATDEQSSSSKKVAEAMEGAVARSRDILGAIRKNSKDHGLLTRSIDDIQSISKNNLESASLLNDTVNNLAQQARLLKEELSKFKF